MRHVLAIVVFLIAAAGSLAGDVLLGADISSLPGVEDGGGVFLDPGADTPDDALAILARGGVGLARIRLWHTPPDGRGGLDEVAALAARARGEGLDVLLDIHYSDTWADPGHQTPPAAWAGLDDRALADSVRAYTRDALRAVAYAGAAPRWVQLGNEITGGMLWDAGRTGGAFDTPAQWDRLARLLRAAAAGVEDALPGRLRPRIMLHTDRGGDADAAVRFCRELAARDAPFDLVGVSYYPWWHGSLDALSRTLDALATRVGRPVMVVETAYPWTLGWFDHTANPVGLPEHLLDGYPATPDGQRDFLRAVRARVAAVPDGLGAGVVWWEPAWIAAPRYGSPWENLTWFDQRGRALPALAASSNR